MKRLLTVFVILMLASSAVPILADGDAPFPTKEWAVSTPEEQGMDSLELVDYIKTFALPEYNLDSILIVRHGYIVAEAYTAPVQKDIPHEMYSASKAVMSALAGIAIDQGYIKSLDDKLLSYFPEITPENMDERKAAITIRDVMKMCSGFECNMYVDPAGDGKVMQGDPKTCLDFPMAYAPGEQWQYCQCNLFLLATIINRTTGMDVMDFANKNLFEPLGIKDAYWEPLGKAVQGFSGLRLTTRDIARFGYLMVNGGQWDGKQIISSQFVKDALAPLTATPFPGSTYGYMWWTSENNDYAMALGYGGQYIMVVPNKDLVVVLTGGYHDLVRLAVHVYPFIVKALGLKTEDKALPVNSEGTTQLQALVEELANPKASPIKELPATASAISGLPYSMVLSMVFQPRANVGSTVSMKALQLDFNGTDTFTLNLTSATDQVVTVTVGLDGLYRVSDFLTWQVAAKGEWLTPNDLRIYLKYVGDGLVERVDLNFGTGSVVGTMYQMTGALGFVSDTTSFAAVAVPE